MPPKKKARVSSRAASIPSVEDQIKPPPISLSEATSKRSELSAAEILKDPWTDDQETSLFKGMIRWIPTGMHKHFRMIAISQQLRNHGYTSQHDSHTRIPGIWHKLATLYNLKALDERDNALGEEETEEDGEPLKTAYFPFELPEADYGDLMFERRLAPNGSSSPSSMQDTRTPAQKRKRRAEATTGTARRASTIEDTEEGILRSMQSWQDWRSTNVTNRQELRSSSTSTGPKKPSQPARTKKVTPKSNLQRTRSSRRR